MKQLYFVRHGQSEANVAKIYAGRLDTPLTVKGRQQAKNAAKAIKPLAIQHIITSPLKRAHQTAEIIAKEIGFPVEKIEYNSLMMERDYGTATGKPWDSDFNLDGFIDVETVDSILERGKLAYQHIKTLPEARILVVGHGTFFKALRKAIHPHEPFTEDDEMKNASVIRLL